MNKYKFGKVGRKPILKGINIATDFVAPTLGVVGKKAILDAGHLDPILADDGAKILNMVELENRWEQMGNRLMRKIVNKMHYKAGSGRTTSAVLARAFCNEVEKELRKGKNPRDIVERLDKGLVYTLYVLSNLKEEATDTYIKKLALTESLDEEVADLIAKAIKELGRNGVITVEESNRVELTLETVKGMRIKQGLISELFVNDPDKGRCVLNNPHVLITDRRVATNSQIVNILNQIVASSNTDLLIVALDVEGEALASLIMNHQRKAINVACVQAPYKGDQQKDFLTDLAILTGATVVSEQAGLFLEKVGMEVLGTCNQVIAEKDETIISGGNPDEQALQDRVRLIEELIEETKEYDKKVAEERLAGLTSGVGVIKVGAFTQEELRLKKDKIEDAINSTRLALDEGILPGGGTALVFSASKHYDSIFSNALLAPFKQMEKNADMNKWWQFWNKRHKDITHSIGYDFKTKELTNMFDSGIVDPYKVERIALETAISIASIYATLDVFSAQFPDRDKNNGERD